MTVDGLNFIEELDSGHFGTVWRAIDTHLDAVRAVKIIPLATIPNTTDFFGEAKTLNSLAHDNVVRIYSADWFDADSVYISMEYLAGGSTKEEAGGGFLPARRASRVIADACRGLTFLHGQGFIHGELKPANILVGDGGEGKLSDFGLARELDASGEAESALTYSLHLAPEVVAGGPVTRLADIYALGATAYRLFNGDFLLPTVADHTELRQRIIDGTFPNRTSYQPFVPTRLRRVLNRAMSTDPDKRYQQVSDFRLALEAVPIPCDWAYQSAGSTVTWLGDANDRRFEVRMIRDGSHAKIETRVAVRGGPLRRRNADCLEKVAPAKIRRELAKLLGRVTENGN